MSNDTTIVWTITEHEHQDQDSDGRSVPWHRGFRTLAAAQAAAEAEHRAVCDDWGLPGEPTVVWAEPQGEAIVDQVVLGTRSHDQGEFALTAVTIG